MRAKILFYLCLLLPGTTLTQPDSTKILQLEKLVESQKVELQSLQEQVEALEDTKKEFSLWIKVLGFPLAGLSIYTIYLAFMGIKRKAEEAVENAVDTKLSTLAPAILKRELAHHPVMVEHNRIMQAKQKAVLILNKTGKDANFEDFLEKKGFINLTSKKIADIHKGDENAFDLFLFNNEEGDLLQGEMDNVIRSLGKKLRYFYFKGKGDDWKNEDVKMAGFATTKERLENNLINALDR